MKLSKMEQRLLNVMGSECVSSKILMDRLYDGLRRPRTNTIPSMVSRLRAKGVKIETLRGKGYRLGYPWFVEESELASGRGIVLSSGGMVCETAPKLAAGLAFGGNISTEIKGMLARYGLNFSVVADLAMKALRAIATPAPAYLLTSPPKYGAIDFVKGTDGVFGPE